MKLYLPLLASILALASCSTSYKSGQTPDDVYFSPARQRDEYVRVEEKDNRKYNSSEESREDRYLRMKTSYRRYSMLDDCDCYCYTGNNYNRYYDYYRYNNYGYNNNWYWNNMNGYYNPYYYNPYYNQPYYSGYIVGNVRPVYYNKPRTGNLNTYGNTNTTSSYYASPKGKTYNTSSSTNDNNYRESGTSAGSFLRNTFGGSNNNSSSNSSNSSSSGRSSSTSSSSGSSSSGSSSGSAPVRKF